MEKANKRILKNTIMLYIRMGVLILVQLYVSRVILKTLGVEDFGIYNLVGSVVILMQFLNSSLTLSVNRFIAYSLSLDNKEKTRKVFSMSLNIHMLLALVILVLAETIGLWFVNTQLVIPETRMFAANVVYQFSVLSFLGMIIRVPYNAVVIAHEDMNVYAYLSIFEGIGKLGAALLLPYFFYDDLIVYSILLFIVSIFTFLGYFLYARWHYKVAKYQQFWSKEIFTEIAKFAGFSTFGNLATSFVNQGQDFILNIFFGTVLNAAKALSVQVNVAVCSFITSIYTASSPQITMSYARKEKDKLRSLVFNVTKLTNYILLLLVLPLALEMNYVLKIWLTEIPDYTAIFCQLILINSIVFNFATPSIIGIQATGRVKGIHLWTGSINLSNLLFVYVAFKYFNMAPYGIYIIQMFISGLMLVATLAIQKKELEISFKEYFMEVAFPVLRVMFLAPILPLLLHMHMQESFIRLLSVTGLSCCSIFLAAYFLGLTPDMRVQVCDYAKKKWKRFRK